MSAILDPNLRCRDLSLHMPNTTLSKLAKKRWHRALATIYCSRALFSIAKIKRDQSDSCFFDIDQSSLTQLVREKILGNLVQLGGVEGLGKNLKTEVKNGIHGDAGEIQHRHKAFGTNTYHKPPTKGFFHFLWEAMKDPTMLILFVCALLSLAFGIKDHGPKEGWYDGGSIIVAIFLVITISAVCNFKQNRQIHKLSQVSHNIKVEVVRSGWPQQIPIFEIVVGDIVCLKSGDQIPADGLFIDGHSLQVDESSMTGESEHVEVNRDQNPFLISGTKVVDGYARMLVTAVGMNTKWGVKMSKISPVFYEQTPLQARLKKLTFSIAKVALPVAFLVLVVRLVRCFTGNTKDKNENRESNDSKTIAGDKINDAVGIISAYLPRKKGIMVTAITAGVVSIPELIPLAAILTLAYAMKRMMADQAMVQNPSAFENMGSATVICTNKTGTITLNQMKVTKFWPGQELIEDESSTSIAANVLQLLHQGVGLNTTGTVYKLASGAEFEFSGSPTEKAILSWAVHELKMNMDEVKQSCIALHVEPFNSERKRSGVLMSKKADNTINVHWKGAAEMILAMCSHFYDPLGNIKPLDDVERRKFDRKIEGMAASSLQCIAFAQKEIHAEEHEDGNAHQKLKENDLILLGLVGIKDSCRPGVKKAVEDCQSAQVNLKMITGDNIFTAKAIATECGILGPNQEMEGAVVEGVEFRNYTPEERKEKVDKICVMARSTPSDKLLMVQCLKQRGHVVAVTGDGTNDAPALKEANIGLSMGIQGTEVAKQSSDIVILDDNFVSVTNVLRWGRCVHNNIHKFIQLQLTVNIAALFINFVAAVSVGEVPLTVVQLLWVNLIMDTLGALALATEQPTKELMEKPPVGQTEPLITNIVWRNLLAQALYQIAVVLILQFRGESIFRVNKKVNDTLIFNTFVLCQIFNEFNSRKLEKKNVFEGIHKNKLFLVIIWITIVLQAVMVEALKMFAGTERLDWGQWGACTGIAFISWPIGWLVKFIPVPEKPLFSYLKWQN
ncbi:putative calcium-transporting ATPase 13, plasma membrane-type [Cornus florida]|uniref:putative calcium-transporting ATPase 13, plasma membrane-type n=1 Tax=Cornus florida TaxID=4283 RepID=UPI00289D4DC0|nr:putative calcium-transporting ATPase 13, plasma membrane-type [Cornus florida]